jgi:hypothetical protein
MLVKHLHGQRADAGGVEHLTELLRSRGTAALTNDLLAFGLGVRRGLGESDMMQHLDEAKVREKLARYLSKKLSLRKFRAWFVPAAWGVDDSAPQSLRSLVYGIKLRLAEHSSGHWTESDLRDKLASLLSSYVVEADTPDQPVLVRNTSGKGRTVRVGQENGTATAWAGVVVDFQPQEPTPCPRARRPQSRSSGRQYEMASG